jgi:toxin YhaV
VTNGTTHPNRHHSGLHAFFLDQLELLAQQVEVFRNKDAVDFVKKNATKRWAAIAKLAFEVIPQDRARAEYRVPTGKNAR